MVRRNEIRNIFGDAIGIAQKCAIDDLIDNGSEPSQLTC